MLLLRFYSLNLKFYRPSKPLHVLFMSNDAFDRIWRGKEQVSERLYIENLEKQQKKEKSRNLDDSIHSMKGFNIEGKHNDIDTFELAEAEETECSILNDLSKFENNHKDEYVGGSFVIPALHDMVRY